jgi:hypothetical protein
LCFKKTNIFIQNIPVISSKHTEVVISLKFGSVKSPPKKEEVENVFVVQWAGIEAEIPDWEKSANENVK